MFIPVAENLHPYDKYAKEVFNLDRRALKIFLNEIEKKGFTHIDFNPGPLKKDREKIVKFFIEGIEELSNLKILIDSPNPEIIELCISFSKRKPIINGFSLEERRLEKVLPLAKKYDLDIIGLLISDSYVPKTLDEKILMAEKMIMKAGELGIKNKRIILDPVIAPLGWQDGLEINRANLAFIKEAKTLFPYIRFIVGISNLTTRSAGGVRKSFFQNILISILWSKGVDFIMLDAFNKDIENTIKFLKILDSGGVFSFAEFFS